MAIFDDFIQAIVILVKQEFKDKSIGKSKRYRKFLIEIKKKIIYNF